VNLSDRHGISEISPPIPNASHTIRRGFEKGGRLVVKRTQQGCNKTAALLWTHETHDNPPTESLSPTSPPIRVITFSHPLQNMMGVVVLETTMSVLYDLTPCDPKTFMCPRNFKKT
jgi:hypothetical protein